MFPENSIPPIVTIPSSWWSWGNWFANEYTAYDSHTFTIIAGQTDVNLKTTYAANLWVNCPFPRYFKIISNVDISFKINSTWNGSYPLTSGQSPYEVMISPLSNLFITTGWSPATITLVLMS